MLKTSEWVSLGHPDKMADYISQCLLDRYIDIDPGTRFAVEVMVKGNKVFLGGEVTSEAHLGKERIAEIVRKAVEQVGYSAEYADEWGRGNCPCADSIEVDGAYKELRNWKWECPPSRLIGLLRLDEPNYARICRVGLCYYKP